MLSLSKKQGIPHPATVYVPVAEVAAEDALVEEEGSKCVRQRQP